MLGTNWILLFNERAVGLPNHDQWTIEEDDELIGWTEYITSSFGRFRCSTCGNKWPSAKIPIKFQLQLSGGTGRVKVRFYKQRCRKCQVGAEYEEPSFEVDNISPVLDRLMIKIRQKCYHENIKPGHRINRDRDQDGPHETRHCQGCAAGICNRGA